MLMTKLSIYSKINLGRLTEFLGLILYDSKNSKQKYFVDVVE